MRIPPPVIAVMIAVATVTTSGHMARLWPASGYASYAALALAVLGTAIDLSAKRLFVRQGTTVNPMSPGAASVMVSSGAYQWSRNPMYLGRLMQLLALALYLANAVGLMGVLLFAIYLDRVQIPVEERALSERFPAQFAAYRARVRRWL